MSAVQVYNEWDPLEEVIVGSALYAKWPAGGKDYRAVQLASKDLYQAGYQGALPDRIVEETEEDIALFVEALEKLQIKVRRPKPIDTEGRFQTLDWSSMHYFCYCPRDVLLAVGDTLIESPNVFRSRYFETVSYRDLLIAYMEQGARWLAAPKPRLLDEGYNDSDPDQPFLRNLEPVFDAANVIRAGKDLFYLISVSGNALGCQWLQAALGSAYRVHPCYDLYASAHIDTTICLLRPGLALVNPTRVNKDNLPRLLQKWKILEAPDMVEYRYSDLPPMASKWSGMNVFMLSPHLAVVDRHQAPLIRMLERHGIEVLPLVLRHGRTLGGGFHCITLDVRRQGKLEDYFA